MARTRECEEEFERCCRRLCDLCREGKPVGRDLLGVWCHNRRQNQCMAQELREGLYQEEVKDANGSSGRPVPEMRQ